MESSGYPKPEFPKDWRNPVAPGYGTFPWPFVKTNQNYQEVARHAKRAIEAALMNGYRHIDTAFTYRNQDLIGESVRAIGLPRNEIFITSKLHQNNNSYIEAKEKIREALELIWGLEQSKHTPAYLDAFLIHYPGSGQPLDAWKALQEARQECLVRHIGVSNFEIGHLHKIREGAGEFPELNQIEFHPWIYNEQYKLLEFCHRRSIAVEGYSPFAQGKRMQDPILVCMARTHKTTVARIILKWCMQHGVKPIFGSRNSEHMRMNAAPYKFTLTDEEMSQLNNMGKTHPIRVATKWNWNPTTAPFGGASPAKSWRSRLRRFWEKITKI